MKYLFALPLICVGLICKAQSTNIEDVLSLDKAYRPSNSSILFSYNEAQQTISYSGNWDFDGDEIKDGLFFVGNGGAHLYFYPKVVLSSDGKVREFRWIALDFPSLSDIEELRRKDIDHDFIPQLVVHDFDDDGLFDIYLNFDTKFSPAPAEWRKRGINSHRVLLKYRNRLLSLTDYRDKLQ